MIPFQQQLDRINASYLLGTDVSALQKELACLDSLIKEPYLDEDKRTLAKGLQLRLDGKISLLNYLYSFSPKNYEIAEKCVNQHLERAKSQNYANTIKVLTYFQAVLKQLQVIVGEVGQYVTLLAKKSGTSVDTALYDKAMERVALSKQLLQDCNFDSNVKNLKLGNVKQLVADYLENSQKLFAEAVKRSVAEKISAATKDVTYYRENTYFPLPENDEGGKSNVLILSTPLLDDARLFAVNLCGDKQKLLSVSAYGLKDKSTEFFRLLFQYVADSGDCLIVDGAENLSIDESDRLLIEAMRSGKRGARVFLTDTSGRAQLYNQALELAAKTDGLNVTDVSLEYLSLPVFQDVKQLFEEKEITTLAESATVLKQMPFMGFFGLNQVVKAFVSRNKNWQEVGKHASSVNARAVTKYLENISQTYLIIDAGWGDFSGYDKRLDEQDVGFDYDGVKEVDLYNVKQIIESNESVFAKCGMIARYCTIGSDDVTAWEKVSREEMLERITLAVRLVFKILRINIYPEVELLDELSNETAGGLCCDGGKVIQFRYDCSCSLEWLYGTIVHESFHALQSQLTHGEWREWYYYNMGISRGRVGEWRNTRKTYDGNTHSKVYKVHMYEADARAFEVDCDDGRNKAWNTMNFR